MILYPLSVRQGGQDGQAEQEHKDPGREALLPAQRATQNLIKYMDCTVLSVNLFILVILTSIRLLQYK